MLGWLGFFGICYESGDAYDAKPDAHLRRRLRAILLRHWKPKRMIVRTDPAGGHPAVGVASVYQGRKSLWALSHTPAVEQGLRNAYFAERGLVSLVGLQRRAHHQIAVPSPQLTLWG